MSYSGVVGTTLPTGAGFWQPPPPGMVETPFVPLAGAQQTWVMTSGDQIRPTAPRGALVG